MEFAHRLDQITPSLTLSIAQQAGELRRQGVRVWDLSAGEPDFDTPPPIKEAAIQALQAGKTKYGPVAGIPELRQAITDRLRQDYNLQYSPEQVIVTNGGKQALYNLMMCLLNPGEEVIIPSPYWVSYPEMVRLAEAKPVFLPTTWERDYKITPAQLAEAITPRTKLFVFNSPANPTGSVYSPEEVAALAEVLEAHPHVWVVADEIYSQIVYPPAVHRSIAHYLPDRTMLVSGFAKAYAMTGWRVGYLVGNREIIKATAMLQGHSTSNVCTFAQYGALYAVTGDQGCVAQMRQSYAERRHLAYKLLSEMEGLRCPLPQGAFYLFPDITQTGLGSLEFCERLLREKQVALVPGIAFGADQCVRLSYATDPTTIAEGCQRVQEFVSSLLALQA
ncbi:MAG: pyridoxal phosphate-dependent aminotransferase [Pseudanabaenaceae cyanobacterium SKYGB_i_bin29]|nr:pyridoxal phosphate-dependent aminotransferase [Pseudanabaenaceae cyanobacterium SKYG29]MDW8420278.1 pyridoxal phosphate-dependent aminotransferase [Pseudanabaenaceae cyanobacterium SKYGB_i_bin29]